MSRRGFAIATVFLDVYNHPRVLFGVLAVIGCIGGASMLFLSYCSQLCARYLIYRLFTHSEPPGVKREPLSLKSTAETVKLFAEATMLLISPLSMYLGLRGGLIWGSLPLRFPPNMIGPPNIGFGAAEVIGGYAFGRVCMHACLIRN